jgi:hypothetical protein
MNDFNLNFAFWSIKIFLSIALLCTSQSCHLVIAPPSVCNQICHSECGGIQSNFRDRSSTLKDFWFPATYNVCRLKFDSHMCLVTSQYGPIRIADRTIFNFCHRHLWVVTQILSSTSSDVILCKFSPCRPTWTVLRGTSPVGQRRWTTPSYGHGATVDRRQKWNLRTPRPQAKQIIRSIRKRSKGEKET